jgi:hypothetical protein
VGKTFGWLTLADDDSGLQIIALRHGVLERTLATLHVGDLVRSQLLLPLLHPVREVVAVILWVNNAGGLIVLDVRDDVAPSLVVVDAQSDDEALARFGPETKGARRPATSHLEHKVTIDIVPAYGVLERGLLDDTEVHVGAGIGLIDRHLDRIAHFL